MGQLISKLVHPVRHLAECFQHDGIAETTHCRIAGAFERERAGIGYVPRHGLRASDRRSLVRHFLRLSRRDAIFRSHERQGDIISHRHLDLPSGGGLVFFLSRGNYLERAVRQPTLEYIARRLERLIEPFELRSAFSRGGFGQLLMMEGCPPSAAVRLEHVDVMAIRAMAEQHVRSSLKALRGGRCPNSEPFDS
jgi:hypothetical protein